MARLKAAILEMRNRVGGVPTLWDFLRFESVDPVLLATKRETYPALIQAVLREPSGLSDAESRALGLLSHEVLPAKRGHELVLLKALLREGVVSVDRIKERLQLNGLPSSDSHVQSTIDTFTLEHHSEADRNRYQVGIVTRRSDGAVELTPAFASSYSENSALQAAVDDLIKTGTELVAERYDASSPFTPGLQYSRKETCRLLGWPRKWTSTIYGYRTDVATGACPIFVTLHKSDEVSASTAYEDALLDRHTMRWYTRSNRTVASGEVQPIVNNEVDIHVFVKKDDAEGSDFYYLGRATAHDAEQTTMPGSKGERLNVVRMLLRFDEPVNVALYDYFHPVVTS